MLTPSELFSETATTEIADKEHRRQLLNIIAKYNEAVPFAKNQYSDLELAKQRAAFTKWKALENLDKYLIEFEANFIKRGGKVIWVQDDEEAIKEILAILKRVKAKCVIKAKSGTTEEISLNSSLKKHQIDCINSDIGEYIQQLSNETFDHPTLPALNKSKEEVARLFNEKYNLPKESSPEDIVKYIRTQLHNQFSQTDVGITGANFIVADIGGIAVSENQGNGFLSMTFPKVHIAIAGVEKILPTMQDLDLFWPLLATYGPGQSMTVYNSVLMGPKQPEENDGPEEMYVILLDNGRSNLLDREDQRQALSCIRCGACLNVCPVYQNIGGHAYGGTIGGPIGSIITPHFKGLKEFKHLSYASTLCGKCTDVCPVKIDLHKLLLLNRRDIIDAGLISKTEKGIYFFWKKGMLNRDTMNKGGATLKNFMLSNFFKKLWGEKREFPKIAPKSFNEMWREKHPDL